MSARGKRSITFQVGDPVVAVCGYECAPHYMETTCVDPAAKGSGGKTVIRNIVNMGPYPTWARNPYGPTPDQLAAMHSPGEINRGYDDINHCETLPALSVAVAGSTMFRDVEILIPNAVSVSATLAYLFDMPENADIDVIVGDIVELRVLAAAGGDVSSHKLVVDYIIKQRKLFRGCVVNTDEDMRLCITGVCDCILHLLAGTSTIAGKFQATTGMSPFAMLGFAGNSVIVYGQLCPMVVFGNGIEKGTGCVDTMQHWVVALSSASSSGTGPHCLNKFMNSVFALTTHHYAGSDVSIQAKVALQHDCIKHNLTAAVDPSVAMPRSQLFPAALAALQGALQGAGGHKTALLPVTAKDVYDAVTADLDTLMGKRFAGLTKSYECPSLEYINPKLLVSRNFVQHVTGSTGTLMIRDKVVALNKVLVAVCQAERSTVQLNVVTRHLRVASSAQLSPNYLYSLTCSGTSGTLDHNLGVARDRVNAWLKQRCMPFIAQADHRLARIVASCNMFDTRTNVVRFSTSIEKVRTSLTAAVKDDTQFRKPEDLELSSLVWSLGSAKASLEAAGVSDPQPGEVQHMFDTVRSRFCFPGVGSNGQFTKGTARPKGDAAQGAVLFEESCRWIINRVVANANADPTKWANDYTAVLHYKPCTTMQQQQSMCVQDLVLGKKVLPAQNRKRGATGSRSRAAAGHPRKRSAESDSEEDDDDDDDDDDNDDDDSKDGSSEGSSEGSSDGSSEESEKEDDKKKEGHESAVPEEGSDEWALRASMLLVPPPGAETGTGKRTRKSGNGTSKRARKTKSGHSDAAAAAQWATTGLGHVATNLGPADSGFFGSGSAGFGSAGADLFGSGSVGFGSAVTDFFGSAGTDLFGSAGSGFGSAVTDFFGSTNTSFGPVDPAPVATNPAPVATSLAPAVTDFFGSASAGFGSATADFWSATTHQAAATQDIGLAPVPPAQDASAQNAPAQNAPAQNAPAQNAPAQNAPAQDAPAQDAPTQDTDLSSWPSQQPNPGTAQQPMEDLVFQDLNATHDIGFGADVTAGLLSMPTQTPFFPTTGLLSANDLGAVAITINLRFGTTTLQMLFGPAWAAQEGPVSRLAKTLRPFVHAPPTARQVEIDLKMPQQGEALQLLNALVAEILWLPLAWRPRCRIGLDNYFIYGLLNTDFSTGDAIVLLQDLCGASARGDASVVFRCLVAQYNMDVTNPIMDLPSLYAGALAFNRAGSYSLTVGTALHVIYTAFVRICPE